MLAVLSSLLPAAPAWAQAPENPPRPTLGLFVEPAPPDAAKPGVVVRDVVPGGPAAKAGLKRGDVIVKAGDQAVRDFDALVNTLAQHKPGDKLSFEVSRDGKSEAVTVTLGASQAPQVPRPGAPARPRGQAFLGVQTQPLTPDVKDRLGVAADKGVLVTAVVPNTPAAKAGLKAEDVITRFDGKDVADPEQLKAAVNQAGPGKKVTLGVVRGKEKKEFTTQLEEAPGDIFLNPRGPFGGAGGFPEPRLPGGIAPRPQRMEQLERRIDELERRLRELEQKVGKSASPEGKK
jgi:serine protease Do